MLWTVLQSFRFILFIASEDLIFFLYFFFANFSISVAMASNRIERFRQKWNVWLWTTQRTFLYNICNEIAVNTNFHVSHYRSVVSCHSNQSSYPIQTLFVPTA